MRRIFFFGLFFLFTAGSIIACECQPINQVKKAVKKSKVVFAGEVFAQQDMGGPNSVHIKVQLLKVTNLYKGKSQIDTIAIIDDLSNCFYSFQLGQKYIVYADAPESKFKLPEQIVPSRLLLLSTTRCTRTQNYNYDEEQAILAFTQAK